MPLKKKLKKKFLFCAKWTNSIISPNGDPAATSRALKPVSQRIYFLFSDRIESERIGYLVRFGSISFYCAFCLFIDFYLKKKKNMMYGKILAA